MKQLRKGLLLIIALTGCSRAYDIKCTNIANTVLVFRSNDTSQSFSGYKCSAYAKGGGFVTELFSDMALYAPNEKEIVVNTDSFRSLFDKYDWKITLYPQGRQVLIKDIAFYEHTEKTNDDAVYCHNPFSFKLNDSFINVPAERVTGNITYKYIVIRY